ncbi:MAG: hypothetical protein H6Q66_648 [Firmicutes bacterium]|nr:hypothetical protein [Bacillota bacterium]
MLKLDFIGGSWLRIKNFDVYNNIVCISEKSVIEEYDPIYYYNNPIPPDIINEILGDSVNTQQYIFIHNLFLSLDYKNTEQLLRWIERFGTLNRFAKDDSEDDYISPSTEPLFDELPENLINEDGELLNPSLKPVSSLIEFKEEISIMKFIVNAVNIIKNKYQGIEAFTNDYLSNVELIETLYYYGFFDFLYEKVPNLPSASFSPDVSTYDKIQTELPNANYVKDIEPIFNAFRRCKLRNFAKIASKQLGNQFLDQIVECFFSIKLSAISPEIKINNGKISFNFSNNSLIGLIYFFLSLDIAGDIIPRKCSAKGCNRHFIPTREDAIYCSDTCKNRAKQQRHRDKKKRTIR